jgi:hypothetical protein
VKKLWEGDTVNKDKHALGRALTEVNKDVPHRYHQRDPLTVMNTDNPAEYLYDLEVHPLNTLFAIIVSDSFFGLDLQVFDSYTHFIQAVSLSFMARVLCTMIRTGNHTNKYIFVVYFSIAYVFV